MEDVGRVFVGLEPTDVVRADLAQALGPFRPLPGRVAPPHNWHLTLRFIGQMDEVAYQRLLAELDQAELGGPFRLRLSGFGAFPNPRRATVLWVGVDRGGDRVTALAEVVEQAVVDIGGEPEERPFHPHLTLSRIRPQQNVTQLVESEDLASVGWHADHITVYRSHLGSTGARYEVLEEIGLTR